MEAAHRAVQVRRAAAAQQASGAPALVAARRNLQPILELGETTFFQFRGRAYGVPPLPWQAGQRLLDAYLRAVTAAAALALAPTDTGQRSAYYAALAELPPLLWRHTAMPGRLWRLAQRLGLLKNPFAGASEADLLSIADFFLQRRTRLSGPPRPALTDPRLLRARQTSSTTS